MTDLYDFPVDHIGRKSFVTVRGHSRSVPKYKTYVGSSGYHLLPEYGGNYDDMPQGSTFILPDKLTYMSPMERDTEITSRSTHREHMKRHGVVEAGDVKHGHMNAERNPMSRAGQDIKRAMGY